MKSSPRGGRDDAIARQEGGRSGPKRSDRALEPLVGSARAGDERDDGNDGEYVVARVTPEEFARLIERVANGEVEPAAEPPASGVRGRRMPRRAAGSAKG